jgi:drug/metabolite transporter (DMT)-like permease
MTPTRIAGVLCLVAGIVLLFLGYRASTAPIEQVSEAITGRFTDRTTWLFVLGGAAVLGGLFLSLVSQRK